MKHSNQEPKESRRIDPVVPVMVVLIIAMIVGFVFLVRSFTAPLTNSDTQRIPDPPLIVLQTATPDVVTVDLQSSDAHLTPAPTERPKPKRVTMSQGTYTIGSDIVVGAYSLELAGDGTMATISVYSGPTSDILNLENMYLLSSTEGVGKVELKDGYIVEITGHSITFRPYRAPTA